MTKNIEEAINAQINAELWSAYLYLSMGTNFRAKGLDGVANWFEVQFKEEQEHAMILYKYMQSRGARVVFGPIAAVQTEWATPLEALIHNINKMAIEANDYATQNRMAWFIDEQVEEEDEAQKLVDAFKMIEGEKVGMFMLDKELGNRK